MRVDPSIERPDRSLLWLLPCALLLIGLTIVFECTAIDGVSPAFRAVPLDDAWIHFVYAENALRTGLLHYNPGEPAAGTSSLLWVILLSLPQRLGVYPPVAAKLLALLAQLGLAALVLVGLRKHTYRPLAILGAVLVCADPVGVFASLSGMEVMLYSLTAFGAVWALLEGRYRLAGVLAALTVAARPDGVLTALCVITFGFLHLAIMARKREKGMPRWGETAFWLVLPSLLAWLLWAYLNWRATGRLLPASFYVRAGGWSLFTNVPPLGEIFRTLAAVGSFIGHPLQWMLYVLGLLWIAWRRDIRYGVLVIFPWALAVLMAGQTVQFIGGGFLGHRYIVPALPFFLYVQLLGVAFVTDLLIEKRVLHRTYRKRHLPVFLTLVALLLLMGDPRVVPRHLAEQRREYASACREIEHMQVKIGRWLDANTAPDARVGTHDAGAITYFSKRETIDIMGLNTPHIAPLSPRVVAGLDYLVTFPALTGDIHVPYREVFRVQFDQTTAVADKLMAVYRIEPPATPALTPEIQP
ncbi:MAG: hypothetical protein P9L99_09215 [Candidatus Lernaella stagnicola]|nr:hypothetical protein [Candidatus Lernaella stagnicola]